MERKRWSVGVEFFLEAETEDEARSEVTNFVDAFPEHVGHDAEGDVIVQDSSEA